MNTINLKSQPINPLMVFSYVVIFLTLFFSNSAKASQTVDICQPGDVLYVWAKTGLNLRQEPSITAKRLTILLPGSEVRILGFTQKRFAVKTLQATEDEQNPFVIKGNWILVQVGGIQGYVLDTYLLPIKAPKAGQSMKHYLIALSEQVSELGSDSDEYSFSATTMNNISIQYEGGEDYHNITVTIPKFSIEDGFVFYNYFNDLQARSTSDDEAEVYLFKNWKTELSVFDDEAGEVNFEVVDGELVITEVMEEGC